MLSQKNNFTYIDEHDRKEDYVEWTKKINQLSSDSDLAIVYSSNFETELKQELYKFGKEFSDQKNKKVIIYEQELGRGGVGESILLNLIDYSLIPVAIYIFASIGGGFFSEFGKDLYEKSLKNIFLQKRKYNKLYLGSAMIQVKLDNKVLQYYFLNHHTEIEKKESYDNIVFHLTSVDKSLLSQGLARFVWDRKNKNWELL